MNIEVHVTNSRSNPVSLRAGEDVYAGIYAANSTNTLALIFDGSKDRRLDIIVHDAVIQSAVKGTLRAPSPPTLSIMYQHLTAYGGENIIMIQNDSDTHRPASASVPGWGPVCLVALPMVAAPVMKLTWSRRPTHAPEYDLIIA
jgi:hypothetical protein